MSTTTFQLTPKVAAVSTAKALKSLDELFSGLFTQSFFLHYAHQESDDELVITLRDNFLNVTLNIQPIEGGAA